MSLLRTIGQEFKRNHILLRSAALTYTTLFAIAPVLLITFLVLSNLPFDQRVDKNLEVFVTHTLPLVDAKDFAQELNRFSHQASKLTYPGVLILVATVVLLLRSIELSFNEIYRVQNARSVLKRFVVYAILTFVGPFLLALSITFDSFLLSFDPIAELAALIGVEPVYLSQLPVVLSAIAFSLIYLLIPNTKVPLAVATVGGILVAVAFELARRAFDLFITNFSSYDLVYGAFAIVPVFLMWVHLSWLIILSGLMLVKILHHGWEP